VQLGRVIGQVVCSVKDPSLGGIPLKVVQGLDERLEPVGKPYVAVDHQNVSGPGDLVWLCGKRDAAIALGDKAPVDAAILGFVDQVSLEESPGGAMRVMEAREMGPGGRGR
jgi:microcompartment protein CcmK/EutM